MLDLESLKLFEHIVQAGSFTRASQDLFLSKSMLKKRVDKLEEELGVTLLSRSPKGIVPTPAGTVLLKESQTIFGAMDELKDRCRRASEQAGARTLKVANFSDYVFQVTNYYMDAYLRRYPHDTIVPVFVPYAEVFSSLHRGLFDVAIAVRPPAEESQGILSTTLYAMRMCGLVSINSPLAEKNLLTREDLALNHVVMHPGWCAQEEVFAWSKTGGVAFNVDFSSSFVQGMQSTCRRGGIYLWPETDTDQLPYKAIPLEDPILSYPAALCRTNPAPEVLDYIESAQQFLAPFIDPATRLITHDWSHGAA